MSSVTELRRTPTQLAEVSGSPRPLMAPSARPPAAGPGTVTQLRPDGGSGSTREVPAPPTTVPSADEGVRSRQHAESSETASEAELGLRISGIARSVAQGALEVLGGCRPLQQMSRWLDAENYERLQLRTNLVRCITTAPALQRGAQPPRAHRQVIIRSARICRVSAVAFEASVVAFDQKRVRAVALRIEQRRGAWRVTALEIG